MSGPCLRAALAAACVAFVPGAQALTNYIADGLGHQTTVLPWDSTARVVYVPGTAALDPHAFSWDGLEVWAAPSGATYTHASTWDHPNIDVSTHDASGVQNWPTAREAGPWTVKVSLWTKTAGGSISDGSFTNAFTVVSAVPESATWVMGGAGLVLLAAVARRCIASRGRT